MSVINRIEIASLLNKHGDISSPWDAKMRHLMLNLRGQSTAMNMENGFGKTTLSDALIGMLSRDRSLMRKTRRKMSPSRDGRPWTHIRVEFTYSSGHVGQNDMLADAGESTGGSENWVFGMYGHMDTDPGFYFYPGRLEQLPISSMTADGKLQLYSNEHFQHFIKQLKPERVRDRESWLDAISLHISRKELEQLASFQKEGGADKSQIFNAIKPRPGEKADEAFFYEVLAPQVMAGASQGETDESEEFIEDLVINSGRKVSELRHQMNEKSNDLQRSENKAERLDELNRSGSKLALAHKSRNEARKKLQDQASCLATLTDKGFPGIPEKSEETDEASALAQEMAIRPGETEPLIPLSALAKISGAGSRKVESYFESKQFSGFRSNGIQIVYSPASSLISGKNVRLYPVNKVISYLDESQQLFRDDANRINSLELIRDAVDRFLDLDTNPFRENYLADQVYLKTLQEKVQELKEHQIKLNIQKEDLETRDKEFTDNETVYTDALKEGLFTEQELENPDNTEAKVTAHLQAIEKSRDDFLKDVGRFEPMTESWNRFQRDHGKDLTPATLQEEKDQLLEALNQQQEEHQEQKNRQQAAEKKLTTERQTVVDELPQLETQQKQLSRLENSFKTVSQQFPNEDIQGLTSRLEQKERQAREEASKLSAQLASEQRKLQELQKLEPDYQAFLKVFPDQKPEGLEDQLWQEKNELNQWITRQESEVQALQHLVADLQQFRQQFPEQQPAQWLEHAQKSYPQLLTERQQVQTVISDIQRQLDDLTTDPVSPNATEVKCSTLLQEQDIKHQNLHQVVADLLDDDDSRKAQWLGQAHNLLFSPVLASDEQAHQAAEIFARMRLSVPVFTLQSLQLAVSNPEASLLGAVIGHQSLAVKALLNPQFIQEWQQQLEKDLEENQKKLTAIVEQLQLFEPESDYIRLAKSAIQAIEQQAEQQLPDIQAALETHQQRFVLLDEQLASENRKLIRSAVSFLGLGGEVAVQELESSVGQLSLKHEEIKRQLNKLDEQLRGEQRRHLDYAEQFVNNGGSARLNELQQDIELRQIKRAQLIEQLDVVSHSLEQAEKQLAELSQRITRVYSQGERELLSRLDDYLQEGGPEFMSKADKTRTSLESQRQKALLRNSVKFDRIRSYLNARADKGGTAALKKQIAEIKSDLKKAAQEQEDKEKEINQIRDDQPRQLQVIHQIDETADRWLRQLAHFSEDMLAELPEPDLDLLEDMPLFQKAEQYSDSCRSDDVDIDEVIHFALTLSDQLEQENTKELSRELARQDKAHQELEDQFRETLNRILNQDQQLFNATEQVRLNSLADADQQAMNELTSMRATLKEQITTNRDRLMLLQESMSDYEDKLHERLSSIIMHSVDNLRVLKKVVCESKGGNAYFVIKADIVSEDGIRNLVRSLLAEIEENQRQIRRRKAQNLSVGSEEKQIKDLQQNLRSQIYRQLFTNISIKMKHDAIRTHGNLFSLNESMSEGQREAVSLMWLVKLSEFAIERELKSVPSQYRRKERKSSESVIILDGLFSKLSHKKLIEDSLESLRNTRGRFQMVGLIHNPNYENDPGIFPTYLVGNVIGGLQGQGGHVTVKDGRAVSPDMVGRGAGEASLFHLHVDEA